MTTLQTNKTIDRPDWLPESVWPHRIRTAHIGTTTLAYTDEGQGPALLLVHDGMWSYIWGQLINRLKDDFRVIALDFPGSGLSPDDGGAASLEADSRLLERFADHLELTRFTVIAHDLGGSVSLGLAGRRPELVDGIVAINTFAWPPDGRSLRAMLKVVGGPIVTGMNVGTNFVFRLTSTKFGVGRDLDQGGRRAFLGPFRQEGPRRRFHHLMRAAITESDFLSEVEEGLSAVLAEKPLLTIYGEKNDPFGFQARFKEKSPLAWEMVIPGGNHFPMCDDPAGVASRIAEWHETEVG